MNLLEYEAKSLLKHYRLPIPRGEVIAVGKIPEVAFPVVVKSQVPIGGRGKLGGIKKVATIDELNKAIETISTLTIKGYTPKRLLVEEALDVKHEYYVSLMINRALSCIELSAHRMGGVEIESQASNEFLRRSLDHRSIETAGELLAEYFGLESHTFALQDLLGNLLRCFIEQDAILLEINPLILTTDNELLAGDCKMILDDAARFRHPEWNFESPMVSANFVTLDTNGTVATIANGAGLAMATVDAVKGAGLSPANFLDVGGGATVESMTQNFQQIMEFSHITAIIINIFGGIVRCDEVARAIVETRSQFPHLPELYIRLSGTNAVEAADVLAAHSLTLYENLEDCIQAVRS